MLIAVVTTSRKIKDWFDLINLYPSEVNLQNSDDASWVQAFSSFIVFCFKLTLFPDKLLHLNVHLFNLVALAN